MKFKYRKNWYRLNTDEKNFKNSDSTVEANYVALKFGDDQYYSLDIDRDRLLIPGKVSSVVEHIYPQATGDCKNNKSGKNQEYLMQHTYNRRSKKVFNC